MKAILIINGHPDPRPERFCAALAEAYEAGARSAGHRTRRLDVGALDFPVVASRAMFEDQPPPESMRACQDSLRWAEHVVLIHPLWLGGVPARTKAFLEQVFRYGFALPAPGSGRFGGLLKGRTLRTVVSMGMPAPIYRWVFGACGVRAVESGVFRLSGVKPVGRTLIGDMEGLSAEARNHWLQRVRELGARGR